MDKNLELNNNLIVENNNKISNEQNSFLESNLGQVVNGGLNLGLKALLPDVIENEVIEIKDALFTEGFSRSA